jgi:hypothetical protein
LLHIYLVKFNAPVNSVLYTGKINANGVILLAYSRL